MSNIIAVTMPSWGLTMEEGMLTEWFVAPGSVIEKGAEMVEIESSKLAGTVEAPASGILRRQIVDVGQTVPCGTLIGIIADAQTSEDELDAFAGGYVIVEALEGDDESAGQQSVQVAGSQINYLRKGSGSPLLFIHGFGGDASGWAFVQEALAVEFDTVALDLPGHGASSKSVVEGSLAAQAHIVAQFIEALATGPVNILAHSMGGGIALALASVRPDLVRGMVLLAPMGLGNGINDQYLQGFIATEKHRDIRAVLQTLFANPELVSRAMVDEIQRYKRVDGTSAALTTIRDAIVTNGVQAADFTAARAGFRGPLAVLWGTEDRIVPLDASSAEGVVQVPGVGHMPQAEAAPKVIETALAILPRQMAAGDLA